MPVSFATEASIMEKQIRAVLPHSFDNKSGEVRQLLYHDETMFHKQDHKHSERHCKLNEKAVKS